MGLLPPNQSIFLRVRRSGTIDVMPAIEMTRIDLRNRTLTAAQLRAALPRGGVDVETVLPTVRPVVEAVAQRGAEAALEYGESFDGVRPGTVRVPADRLDDALAALAPDVRAALEVAIDRARAVHADQRRTDTTTTLGSRRDGHGTLGAGGAGRAVCAGRQRGLPVECGDERRAGPDRGRRIPGDRQPAASAVRRSAASDHPCCRATARRRRGVGGRRCAGHRAAGVWRHRHRRRRARVGRHDHRPGQHLRHRRQAGLPQPRGDRRRGRADRDRDTGRPHRRPGARRRRPDQPGRARRDGRQRVGDAERGACGRDLESACGSTGNHGAPRAGDRGADRPAVGDRACRRHRRRRAGGQCLRRRAPGDPDRRRARCCCPNPFGGRHFRGPVLAGEPWRLLRGLQSRAAHGRMRPPFQRIVGADVPARHPRRRIRRGRAQRRVRPRDHAGEGRGPAGARRGGAPEVREA